MKHNFSNHSVQSLVVLADCLKGTLKNVACEAIHGNVKKTRTQVLKELKKRATA